MSGGNGNPNWVKGGPSPNPSGRPKGAAGVAREIMKMTDDLRKVYEWVWSVFLNENLPLSDRRWAGEWLADRGIGKAAQSIQLEQVAPAESDDAPLTDAQLAALDVLLGLSSEPVPAPNGAPAIH
jgi:hypothetical protein